MAWEVALQRSTQSWRWKQGSDQHPQFPGWPWQQRGQGTNCSWVADWLWDSWTADGFQGSQWQWWGWGALPSWVSSNISSSLPQTLFPTTPAGPFTQLLAACYRLPVASEGLNTQRGPAAGQSGHQACHPVRFTFHQRLKHLKLPEWRKTKILSPFSSMFSPTIFPSTWTIWAIVSLLVSKAP